MKGRRSLSLELQSQRKGDIGNRGSLNLLFMILAEDDSMLQNEMADTVLRALKRTVNGARVWVEIHRKCVGRGLVVHDRRAGVSDGRRIFLSHKSSFVWW